MSVGFIILRHVNNDSVNKYWIHCYNCIRRFYPDAQIMIVDDNSNPNYLTNIMLKDTIVIDSEYPGRGEILPYYYYLQHKIADTVMILHDSVFINSPIDFSTDSYKSIWQFEHNWDQIKDESEMIDAFNDENLKSLHRNKAAWKGCFGGMSIITHDYLTKINQRFDISKLLQYVRTRYNRMSLERVIAVLLRMDSEHSCLLGDIHKYCPWGIKFDNYKQYAHLPVIKVWTGR